MSDSEMLVMAVCLGVTGTADSDVKCERCPDGTFSDSVSSMDRCRPHTKWVKDSHICIQLFWELRSLTSLYLCLFSCHGRVVVKKGDATSDTECESEVLTSSTWLQNSTEWPHIEILLTTASTVMSTVSATSDSKTPRGVTDSTPTFNSLSEATTKNPPHSTVSDGKLGIETD